VFEIVQKKIFGNTILGGKLFESLSCKESNHKSISLDDELKNNFWQPYSQGDHYIRVKTNNNIIFSYQGE
jgi:hypothetical protein